MKKETIIQLIIILILTIILGVLIFFTVNEMNTKNFRNDRMNPMEENTTKETTANDVDSGTAVISKQIDLSQYDTNITITEAGEYILSGNTKNSVLVNANDKVTIILENVDIQSEKTAAIANISENDLVIKIANNTENKLSDGGSSEYEIVSFEAKENFKTLIISNSKISSGTYYLYANNEKTTYSQVVK